MQRLLFDPQTSGGLLMAVAPALADDLAARLRADGFGAAVVGSVRAGSGLTVEP
jgi:selenide,water dikinase